MSHASGGQGRARCAEVLRHRHCSTDRNPLHPTALSTPLTIMHLLAPAPVGGLETVVSTLAATQSLSGHRVVVVPTLSATDDGQHFIDSLAGRKVEVVPLLVRGRAYLKENRQLVELCRNRNVTIVHTHGYRSDIVGGLAGRKAGVPIVTTVHGFTGGSLKNRGLEALQRLAFRAFDAVAVVSRPQYNQLRDSGISDHRLHLVPNALAPQSAPLDRSSARHALGLPEHSIIIGWVGRLSHEKGVDVFIDALRILDDPRVCAAVFGDGPVRASEELRTLSIRGSQFRWLGAIPDAARYFAAFDLFVMSSRAEGLPMVLLEAMAAGVPIVTTRVGGIPDLLSPSEGMLVPPDDPSSLAAAIRAAIVDPAAAATRAQAAQRRQRADFSVGPWSERYESIYRDLLAARTSTAERT